jgi:hypothetical protein
LFWSNFALAEPYRVGDWWSQYATTEKLWTHKERLKALESEYLI